MSSRDRRSNLTPSTHVAALLLNGLALVSGGTALMAQVVWVRLIVHHFGTTYQVAAFVLAMVLSGLAIGAVALGRWADTVRSPLRWAGLLLALSGLAMTLGGQVLTLLVRDGYRLDGGLLGIPWGTSFAWLALSSLVVLPPMILIGGILPALVRASRASRNTLRPRIGLLYGLETIGGAIGSLLAGFVLIRAYGLHGTLWIAAGSAMVVGVMVALIARPSVEDVPDTPCPDTPSPVTDDPSKRLPGGGWLLLAACLAGFAGMGFEIVWLRLLLLVLSSDTYAYSGVTASVLFGIAVGSFFASLPFFRNVNALRLFAWLQIAAGGISLLVMALFGWLSAGAGQRWLASLDGSWAAVVGGRFAICLGLLLIPTTLMGMGFPVLAGHFLQFRNRVGGGVGQLYSTIVVGNVAGALVTGTLLIVGWGLQQSLVVLAMIHLASAVFAMVACHTFRAASSPIIESRWKIGVQCASIVMVLVIGGAWSWLEPVGQLGLGRSPDNDVLYYREGPVATVAVSRQADGARVMAVDGVIIGQSHGGVDQKQRMLAHLPFLLRPEQRPKHLLTIGLGTGVIAGELVRQQDVQQVDCVELSPAVIEGARQFGDVNEQAHTHPRITLILADGVRYVRRHSGTYDAIVCDAKSRPGHVGNGAFFSSDYYAACRQRLRPGGLHVQWVSLETPPRALRVILRTFTESFPHTRIGIAPPDSIYLVGSDQPFSWDTTAIQQHLASPQAARLRWYGWQDDCDLRALFSVKEGSVQEWLDQDVPTNTLAKPVLEFLATDIFSTSATQRKEANLRDLLTLQQRDAAQKSSVGVDPPVSDCQQSAIALTQASLAMIVQEDGWFDRAITHVKQGLEVSPQHTQLGFLGWELHLAQAAIADNNNQNSEALDHYRHAVRFRSDDLDTQKYLAQRLRQVGDLYNATGHYYEALRLDPDNVDLRLEFAFVLATLQRGRHAVRQFQTVIAASPENAQAHLGLGMTLLSQGRSAQALDHLRKAVALDASLKDVVARLGVSMRDG